MAWNGSNKEKLGEDRRNASAVVRSSVFARRLILSIGIAGVVVVVVAFLLLTHNNVCPTADAHDRQPRPIAEVLTTQRTKGVLSDYLGKVKVNVTTESQRTNSSAQAEAEELRKKFGRIVVWKTHDVPIFTNVFENVLCQIVTAEPGERFLELDLIDDFDERYNAALERPASVTGDDDENVAELKRIIREATEQVRQAVQQGRKPSEVILEARDELNKIADFRDEVQAAFDKEMLTMTDPKAVLQLAEDANKLLREEYGAIPIDCPLTEEDAQELMIERNEEALRQLDSE